MSYENYSKTSKNYDELWKPIAMSEIMEEIVNVSKKLNKRLSELVILDAGCGTGNYIKKIYPFVKKVIGLEYNEGMLK